jgi:hypothetical protein
MRTASWWTWPGRSSVQKKYFTHWRRRTGSEGCWRPP